MKRISNLILYLIIFLILCITKIISQECNSQNGKDCSGDNTNRLYYDVLSEDPDIRFYHNFLKEGEAEHLIKKYGPRLKESSLVGDKGARNVNSYRTSTSAFLLQTEDSVIKAIEDRIMEHAKTERVMIEGLQLLNYKKGQYFKAHNDWFQPQHIETELGQR